MVDLTWTAFGTPIFSRRPDAGYPGQCIRESVETDITTIIVCKLRAPEIVVIILAEIREIYCCFACDAVTTRAVRN